MTEPRQEIVRDTGGHPWYEIVIWPDPTHSDRTRFAVYPLVDGTRNALGSVVCGSVDDGGELHWWTGDDDDAQSVYSRSLAEFHMLMAAIARAVELAAEDMGRGHYPNRKPS